MTRPVTSTSTMSPRWTLSSMPLRRWRARIGATVRPRAVERVVGRAERCAGGGAAGAGTIDVGLRVGLWQRNRLEGEDTPPIATMGGARSTSSPGGPKDTMPTPTLHVSQHPAVLHKLAILRDERTEPKKFREVVRELSWLLGYEALADVAVRPIEIRTPLETDDRRTSSPSGSGSCRSSGRASGWSTRCSS